MKPKLELTKGAIRSRQLPFQRRAERSVHPRFDEPRASPARTRRRHCYPQNATIISGDTTPQSRVRMMQNRERVWKTLPKREVPRH